MPEAREHQVRAFDGVPHRWLSPSPGPFHADVEPDEYFTFQIGVVNTQPEAGPVTVLSYKHTIEPRPVHGQALPDLRSFVVRKVNCINLEGVTYLGQAFTQNQTVDHVGALWFGVNVSATAPAGASERLAVTLHFADAIAPLEVEVVLTVVAGAVPLRTAVVEASSSGPANIWMR